MLQPPSTGSLPIADPYWYRRAIFYEVLVRGFFDANGDGNGDLRGLTEKLDYLEWLGIDCLWLLPFYQSPLRDGGYDISDFLTVLPDFGTVDDVATLIDEAHRRGIRVIADMVMNHTSDQHPWFLESRQDRTNPKADWYVWGDDDQRWSEARVIFVDTEPSNWTWDPQREQYYWHRFFHHQPDLNYDNPEVRRPCSTWCSTGSAWASTGSASTPCPTCSSGTAPTARTCPRPTSTCAGCARRSTPSSPARSCWPRPTSGPRTSSTTSATATSATCASTSRSCRACSWRCAARSATPIAEILAQTPEIPDGCQWGIFLRNHDELTLEMVTDEERDYMYAEYATDPRMRRNVGICRRLFPLLDNDRRQAELFHALLFSLPGSPILYYGDEIGMGDNIYLGDRDGVRTPMQWSPDRNGGFSTADFAQLYLPPLMDPVYGFQAVNVEAQRRDPASFLHWLRRHARTCASSTRCSASAASRCCEVSTPSVFAYLRTPAEPATRADPCCA